MKYKSGEVDTWMIVNIVLGVLFLAASGFAVWAFISYQDQKNNVDSIVAERVATAKKEQADEDDEKFSQREKEPNRGFVGPEDYGRLTFKYPKTWSVYVASDASNGGNYEAYLNPITVPTVSSREIFALRVTIYDRDFDQLNKTYEPLVKKGDLKSTPLETIGETDATGIRYDGAITRNMRGSLIVFKLRDKSVVMQTDAETFKPDFDALIKTIDFNK
ncbi:MAG: hypothetical protein LBH36_02085 [Candidatus Nomurabacteria bacterium]|jgi:hypothetical protein|nr:hypothetical protein [Candidatus Nomurabacteria bacterium]